MKENKSKFILIVSLVLLVLTLQNILAIGITPGRTTINFEPNLHQEVPFSIINTENKDMSVVFFVRGELNDTITLKKAYAEFSSDQNSQSFAYLVDLPESFDIPGRHEAEIVALEMPKDLKEQGTFIGATVAVVTQLHVHVPYPSKYIEGELNIVDNGGKVLFLVPVINRGKLGIGSVKTVIDVYTVLNEKVATIETNAESLETLERTELSAEWDSNVNPGKYYAVATIFYDNEKIEVEKEFNIGQMLLEIKEINVRDFQLGEIAKFEALVENKWSNDVNDIFLNILVYNNEGQVMADFKSPNYNIKGLSKEQMVAYWDTVGVYRGTYDGELILRYGDKSIERNIQLNIGERSLEVVGLTGQVLVRGTGSGLNTNTLIIILIGGLIIVNIIWFVVVKRLMKKKK